jgi:hypothetical protein
MSGELARDKKSGEVTMVNKALNSDSRRRFPAEKDATMNSRSSSGRRLQAPLLGCLAAFALAAPAAAGGLYHEHAYADSFGNLVVYAPSGYKRIVVGKGYLADRVASAAGEEGPDVVRLHHTPGQYTYIRHGECAVLLHGRSYMYGLPDNVVPVPAKNCD